jgi:multidrug efflux pump subunit AcrB
MLILKIQEMNIPRFSINNYQFTLTVFVALLVLGILSFIAMPQREDPVVEIPNSIVVAVFPGANPEDMESQVVDVIEEAVNELDDLKEVSTIIKDGVSVTEVESLFGGNPDDKFDELLRQVNQIRDQLPSDLYQLDVRQISTSTVNIMQMALVSEKASYQRMKEEAERLKKSD